MCAEATALTKDSKVVDMVVTVKNTGSVAGKKVVEAFANPDYKDGGIEKASRNLVGFAKTSLLAPGASEDVTIEFNAEDMASYDYNDANKDDHYGYEIDAGKIVVGIQSDSHTVDGGSAIFTAASNIDYQTDGVTDNQVKNLFSTYETKKDASGNYVPDTTKVNPNRSLPMEGDGVKFTAMTRASANHLVTSFCSDRYRWSADGFHLWSHQFHDDCCQFGRNNGCRRLSGCFDEEDQGRCRGCLRFRL
jgi:hypothetical protein